MNGTIVIYVILAALLAALACIWILIFRTRRLYRKADEMLDAILERNPLSLSGVQEGYVSALASKAEKVQEILMLEVEQARQEKEQVKQLISNMSHQLKTPLANLMMYQEMLRDPALTENQRQHFTDKMENQTEKISWIIQSLFKMTRLEQNAIEFQVSPLPIQDTIMEAVGAIYEKAGKKNIVIEQKCRENHLLLHNKSWTAEALVNVLENAVKYTEEGGSISIEVTPMELYTEIAVSDTGMGVPPSEHQAIFQRFYRGSNARQAQGSGIGLYLSRLILEQEKGYLTFSPGKEKGSRFTILLPNSGQNSENAPCNGF